MKNLGQQLRKVRLQKKISLNAYANHLGVSPGYLSNLETGKTQTIQLSLLDKLQRELRIIPDPNHFTDTDELDLRIQRIRISLKELYESRPDSVEYLLSTIEEGTKLFYQD